MARVTLQIRIHFDEMLAIGPGRIQLLEGVQFNGSLSQAARDMDMSYRRAWLLMQSLNESLGTPASVPVRGGRRGGGTTVTPAGHALIRPYPAMEAKLTRSISRQFARVARPDAISNSKVRTRPTGAK